MASKIFSFSVPIVGTFFHNEETYKILKPHKDARKQSEFIREAIIEFAYQSNFLYGMNMILENKKPDYINDMIWSKILEAHERTHYIRYGYVIAFFWLLSLPDFEKCKKSVLMRKIVIWYHQQNLSQ